MMVNDGSYRAGVLLVPAGTSLDELNALLTANGFDNPLTPRASPGARLRSVDVAADPLLVQEFLRDKGVGGVRVDHRHRSATYGQRRLLTMYGMGCKIGHGLVGWTPAGEPPAFPARRARSEIPGGRPVVALLDTGVIAHPWLDTGDEDDRFWSEAPGWTPPGFPDTPKGQLPSHHGHGTFIAGLIRRYAPDATVLSLHVMDDDGEVYESDVIAALDWLAQRRRDGQRVDLACLAFGRPEHDGEPPGALTEALGELLGLGVEVVASAGNDGSTRRTVPACYATGVGAGISADQPEDFSNRGDWVARWEPGRDFVSTMPMTADAKHVADGHARWGGTSFSAAVYAAKRAQRLTVG